MGIRCASVSDWSRAVKYLKLAYDSHEVLYGKRDPRTLNVGKLLSSVKKSRSPNVAAASSGNNATATAGTAQPALPAETEGPSDHMNITDDDISPLAEAAFPIHAAAGLHSEGAAGAATAAEDEKGDGGSAEHRQYVFPAVNLEEEEEDYGLFLGGSLGAAAAAVGVQFGTKQEPAEDDPTSPLSSHSGGNSPLSGINLVRAMARSTAAGQLQDL